MPPRTRRYFLTTAGRLVVGSVLLPSAAHAAAANDSRYTIGLSQYSLRAMFKDGSLDPLDFPAFTVDNFGIRAIDLWEGGLPQDKLDDSKYLGNLKERASQAGTELFLLMAGVLDADPAKRAASLKKISPSIERARLLGCELVRVFLKASGKDEQRAIKGCVEALKPLADAAAKKGRTIAIEPGASVLSRQGAFLAKVAKELNHPACKLMPDFGKLVDNVYDGTQAMLPYAATISCKMHTFAEDGTQPDFDYVRLMKIIDKSAYRGILAIEWEGNRFPPVEGVKASQRLLEKSLAALEG